MSYRELPPAWKGFWGLLFRARCSNVQSYCTILNRALKKIISRQYFYNVPNIFVMENGAIEQNVWKSDTFQNVDPPTYRWFGWLTLPFGSLKQEQDNETVSNRRSWQCSCTLWCGNISTEETEALGGMFWCSTVHRGSFKPTRLCREAGGNSPPNSTSLKKSFFSGLAIIWRLKLIGNRRMNWGKKWLAQYYILEEKIPPFWEKSPESLSMGWAPILCENRLNQSYSWMDGNWN